MKFDVSFHYNVINKDDSISGKTGVVEMISCADLSDESFRGEVIEALCESIKEHTKKPFFGVEISRLSKK